MPPTEQHRASLEAVRAETARVKAKADAAEAELAAARARGVQRAIDSAVQRGVIPPKHHKLRAAWQAACSNDSTLIELLDLMPGSPALAGRRGDEPPVHLEIPPAVPVDLEPLNRAAEAVRLADGKLDGLETAADTARTEDEELQKTYRLSGFRRAPAPGETTREASVEKRNAAADALQAGKKEYARACEALWHELDATIQRQHDANAAHTSAIAETLRAAAAPALAPLLRPGAEFVAAIVRDTAEGERIAALEQALSALCADYPPRGLVLRLPERVATIRMEAGVVWRKHAKLMAILEARHE